MSDPLIARFASACGATAPLDLRVDLVGGGTLAEGSVAQPFTLVGRDDACDVTLSDPEINPRHLWVQVLGGRVFAVDLGSRTGMTWPGGERGSGWLDPGTPAKLGPFLLRLRCPAADRPSTYPSGYNPLVADPGVKVRPAVALEFRNGRRAKDRWNVNRLLTLIGRAADCKIHLTADDISAYHCGLVSTPTGLWVVDLSGRGVVVNGERMRVAPLPHGAELWVGRFLIGCHYQNPPAAGKTDRFSRPAGASSAPTHAGAAPPVPLASAAPTEDEVELGEAPDGSGLPSSHIMADAFRHWGANISGPMSHPIHVSGSGPNPGASVTGSDATDPTTEAPALSTDDDWSVAAVLRQMADLHGRAGAEFQRSLGLLTRAFANVNREHLAVLVHELTRIQELTAAIAALQLELTRQTLETAADERARAADAKPTDPRPGAWVPPSTKTPLPHSRVEAPPPPPPAPHPVDRLGALQQERAARWQALVTLFTQR